MLGAKRLVANIHPGNRPTQRVAEKIGLRPEKHAMVHGRDCVIYAAALDYGWPGDRTDYRRVAPLVAATADRLVPGGRRVGRGLADRAGHRARAAAPALATALAVTVTLGGHSYRTTATRMGGRFLIPLSAENRTAAAVAAGDEVEVDLEPDTAPREVEVPADLAEALEKTRANRLAKTVEALHVGQRTR